MFQANGLLKFTEQDIWEEGCQPHTSNSYSIDMTFTGAFPEEVIKKIAGYIGCDEDGIERNSCDEKGRVDFAITEDEEGTPLSPRQWEQFKKGNIKAWYAIYTAYIEETTPANL
jgi:hypothetical protein